MRSTHLLPTLFLSSPLLMAKAFSMSVGAATECDPFSVSWTGGQSPFEITLFFGGIPAIFYHVSSSEYQGSYAISQLPLPQGSQFVLTMSDATGFATGGTTDLITVGGPTSSSGCNTTLPSLSYFFSNVGFPLQQCGPFEFNGYQGAVLPVTFVAIIPGGESFLIQSGVTTTSYIWTADVQAGPSIMFSMWDANGNSGGCSDLQSVGPSNDASCLSSSSPSSITSIPQPSQLGSSSPSTSQTGSITSTNISVATLAGIAVGGAFALATLVILGLRFIRGRRRNEKRRNDSPPLHLGDLHLDPDISTTAHVYPLPYQGDHVQSFVPSGQTIPSMTRPAPQDTYSSPRASTSLRQGSSAGANTSDFVAYNDTSISISSVLLSALGKGSTIVMTPTGTRYIVHTDIADAPPTASHVIELPPQYLERPGPAWQ